MPFGKTIQRLRAFALFSEWRIYLRRMISRKERKSLTNFFTPTILPFAKRARNKDPLDAKFGAAAGIFFVFSRFGLLARHLADRHRHSGCSLLPLPTRRLERFILPNERGIN